MAEFTKYRKNIWKAEAIEDVATRIKYCIENEEESKKYYENRIVEEKGKDEDNRSEWQIENYEECLGKVLEKIKLYEQVLKIVDKELAF